MIDYWTLAKDFRPGDYVQRLDLLNGRLSPFMGRVVASHPGLGVLDVQWPYGSERVFTDDVVKVHKSLSRFLPPSLDQTYSGYDVEKGRTAAVSQYRDPLFTKKLAHSWATGASDVASWDALYSQFGNVMTDESIRNSVTSFYSASEKLFRAFLKRKAAYWYAENRTYRVTKAELENGCPSCPKCGTAMKKTTYKMDKGKKVKLFACPKDLFLLKASSLKGPDGKDLVGW